MVFGRRNPYIGMEITTKNIQHPYGTLRDICNFTRFSIDLLSYCELPIATTFPITQNMQLIQCDFWYTNLVYIRRGLYDKPEKKFYDLRRGLYDNRGLYKTW